VTHLSTGVYKADTGSIDVSQCAAVATIGQPAPPTGEAAFIRADNTIGDSSSVTVWTYKKDGAAADYPFQLAIHC
jgi:hypothetical protein